jgi:23S rRNA (cytidine1920-2'-O)/16S rRNA (cytidine1409-2'-O)-methyltransferase
VRVIALEKTNARYLTRGDLGRAYQRRGEPGEMPIPDLAVMDVSFISAELILPQLARELPLREIVLLVKPQFEAGRGEIGKGGIVREASVHRAVLGRIAEFAREMHYPVCGLTHSPIRGGEGNIEFLALLRKDGAEPAAGEEAIARVVAEAHAQLGSP